MCQLLAFLLGNGIQQLFFSEQRVVISKALLVFTGGREPKRYKMTCAVLKQPLSQRVFVGVAQSWPTGIISLTGRLIMSLKDGLIVIQQALLGLLSDCG